MSDAFSGALRDPIDAAEVARLLSARVLITDGHRRRPRYFDGRFLAARDLTRDQGYFLARQAGFARALGAGVVEGLQVERADQATSLRLRAGFGFTPSGEWVGLTRDTEVALADLARLQILQQQLGRVRQPAAPLRNRHGVFLVGLRPVEFTANPVASYPGSLAGERQVEDGDIVEGSVVTLSPVADSSTDDLDGRRAALAREAFVGAGLPGAPAEVLPLALVALAGDAVQWIDLHLVRRAAGQAHADVLGFGFAPRLQREAHLAQYADHLGDVLARVGDQRFPAAQFFQALPAAGPMPKACVSAVDFTQSWFPPDVVADLSIIPDDELPALVEESLLLPPIDLSLDGAQLASTTVAVLLPLPRTTVRRLVQRLGDPPLRPAPAAAARLPVKRLPLEALRLMAAGRLGAALAAPPEDARSAAWREALEAAPAVWYARRRNLAFRDTLAGEPVPVNAEVEVREALESSVRRAALLDALNRADVPSARAGSSIGGLRAGAADVLVRPGGTLGGLDTLLGRGGTIVR